jgi:hypothetical protein
MTSPQTERLLAEWKQAKETLEVFERFADSLDELEKVAPIPEDIYNMTANTVRALREYLNAELEVVPFPGFLTEWANR